MMGKHFPAFVAGATLGAVAAAVVSEREAEWQRWAAWAEKRIAELEAELAEYRNAEHIYGKHFAARAEKAEAEVERLRAFIGHLWDNHPECDYAPCQTGICLEIDWESFSREASR